MKPNFNTLANAKVFLQTSPLQLGLDPILLCNGLVRSKIKEMYDEVCLRHLQKHIQLSIINTPPPDDKNSFNLLLLSDEQDMDKLREFPIMLLESNTTLKLTQNDVLKKPAGYSNLYPNI